MTSRALTMPLDITWQRLAFSRDMIDTSFGDLDFPPKWRSSMAIYAYAVPEEQTAESYPDARIVYLRLTCSITGWNPSEDLRNAVNLDGSGGSLDELQSSLWEAIQAQGWATTYWPCLGAIAQVAIYPGEADDEVSPDDFPYILDFEPKKRELYETRSESGEFISGSSNKLNVQKGSTTTQSTEESNILTGGSAGFAVGPIGGSASISGEWGTRTKTGSEEVNVTNTDASRERRETTSFSTTINQMYQLFNGYHLGTNRAVFYVEPRPHIVDQSRQANSNLIRGQRRLEGLQDLFVVVHVPTHLQGVCVQASLDTGHQAMFSHGVAYALRINDETPDAPGGGGGLPPLGDIVPPNFPEVAQGDNNVYRMVVTRRIIRNCATFDEGGQLVPAGVPTPAPNGEPPELPRVVFEMVVPGPTQALEAQLLRARENIGEAQFARADQMNRFQHEFTSAMLSGFSAGRYRSRRFVRSDTFRRLVSLTLRDVDLDLNELVRRGRLDQNNLASLRRLRLQTVGDLFKPDVARAGETDIQTLHQTRDRVIDAVMGAIADE
jgi:hypothetical protein